MLFDERDLNTFDNNDSKDYFQEILQCYYGKNYRAAVVLLYSFVIYDLFCKLKTMASEGDTTAKSKMKEISKMIENDIKYSEVENTIIDFFKDNFNTYFRKFIENIQYLKACRNKCAHLNIDSDSLYTPKDYQVKMLICSMFDNVLSVKASFIMDLFPKVQTEIENYTAKIWLYDDYVLEDYIIKEISNKYLNRMTEASLLKSYKTFTKLLFVSEDNNCKEYIEGLYAFTYSMTNYIITKGYSKIFEDSNVKSKFSKIEVDSLKNNKNRRIALTLLMINYPKIMSIVEYENSKIFTYISECVLSNPLKINQYKNFYPREEKTLYEFFKNFTGVQQPAYIYHLYNELKECEDFNLEEYLKIMIESIPKFNGFDSADRFMDFFLEHIKEISVSAINEIMQVYKKNKQCCNRGRHSTDIEKVNEYIKEIESVSENTDNI